MKTIVARSNCGKYALEHDTNLRDTLWLQVKGNLFNGMDAYLMIIPQDNYVKGIYGFGGMGYVGPLTSIKINKGLKQLGFNVKIADLRKIVST